MNATTTAPESGTSGVIAWFTRNPVAANLLMVIIVAMGVISFMRMPYTLTPAYDVYWVETSVAYPGAAPEEIEQSIVLKIEEALREVEGIETVVSRSLNSLAQVRAKVHANYDIDEVQSEIRGVVSSIPSLPADAEEPVVARLPVLRHVVQVELYSDTLNPFELRELADEIKTELLAFPEVSKIEMYGLMDYEISIEVDENTLRKHGLTLEQVALAVRASSLDLPGGTIRSASGDILVQTRGRRFNQKEFESIPLLNFPDGRRLLLGDIAKVRDGFIEDEVVSRLNQKPSLGVGVGAYNNQNIVRISKIVREYVEEKRPTLPPGVNLALWADASQYLEQRLDMMRFNLLFGALLVFMVLALFMDLKLAFWVMMGIPIAFCGALALMPHQPFGLTLNLVSLFALILVLGIIVDDAIIVGESAYAMIERDGHGVEPVIKGVHRILTPSVIGVTTTIVAFTPTVLLTGQMAAFPREIGFTVILCLLFSIIESKLILPAHLAHTRPSSSAWLAPVRRAQGAVSRVLQETIIRKRYRRFLSQCIDRRYLTVSVFTAVLLLFVGIVGHGLVRVVLSDNAPGDFLQARLEMTDGTPRATLITRLETIERAILSLDKEHRAEHGGQLLQHVNLFTFDQLSGLVLIEVLEKKEGRKYESRDILRRWREKVGEIPGAEVLAFADGAADFEQGRQISLDLTGADRGKLEDAALLLQRKLRGYHGVFDVRTDISDRNDKFSLTPKPASEALGMSLADIGNQVRHAFYGYEAQRIQRGNDEIKVMVRYPKYQRQNIATLRHMHIRAGDGAEVPLSSVADVAVEPVATELKRVDGAPTISVSSDADTSQVTPAEITEHLLRTLAPRLAEDYGVTMKRSLISKEQNDLVIFLFIGFMLAMFVNYCLLAMPLRSYLQPLIVMGAVPFGVIGAIIGHMLLNMPLSMLSVFGVIAAAGVVINDGLILVSFINKERLTRTLKAAVIAASISRFRAILLTSLTTFVGLLPIMLEPSAHARYVAPMAVSLGFGVLFATGITLLLLPCMYMALQDLAELRRRPSEAPRDAGEVSLDAV